MPRANWRDGDGYYKRAPKQGAKPKPHGKSYNYRWEDKQKDIDVCLNCTEPQCKYGLCGHYRKERKTHDD